MASLPVRIPLYLGAAGLHVIDDLDLAFLLEHGGAPVDFRGVVRARAGNGSMVPVQWLNRAEPSLVRQQRRGSLLIEVADKDRQGLTLLVEQGPDKEPGKDAKGVNLQQTQDAVEIALEGKPFVTYRFNTKNAELPRPYFHPLIGPTGQVITQLGEVPGKREKHFHHTALWIAHQNFQAKGEPACDNWQIGRPNSSKIDHVRFDTVQSGPLAGRFIERLNWLNVKGDRVLLDEIRTVTIPRLPAQRRVLDVEIKLTCHELPVTFNRTPYHLLACRVLDALLPGKGGAITNSAGQPNPADGAAANWIDISGRLGDDWQGVALFNHASNLRHPTPCLQFSRQTIGLAPTHAVSLTLQPKEEWRLRYRVFIHAGNVTDGRVAAEYQAFIQPAAAKIGGPE